MNVRHGDIAWAWIDDGRGNSKLRPIVVIDVNQTVLAVAITSSPIDVNNRMYVSLPWHEQGNVSTRLKKQSWAACDWIVDIEIAAIQKVCGHVSDSVLLTIRARMLS